MKKTFIILGILLPLLLLAGWAYLLLYGAPESLEEVRDMFIPQESADTPATVTGKPADSESSATPSQINVSGGVIKLSTRPVAGALLLTREEKEYVRYVERGTGHIFEVSLDTGSVTRISNTTVPRTTEAVWSPLGNRVALTSEIAVGKPEIVIGTLIKSDAGGQTLDTFSLPYGAENLAFADSGDAFFYTMRHEDGSTGYRYDLKTAAQKELFTTKLRLISATWDTTETGSHYVYTDPSGEVLGYLYEVENGGLQYVMEGALGLTADRAGAVLLVGHSANSGFRSALMELGSGKTTAVGIATFPEKCAGTEAVVICAAPLSLPPGIYPDMWYQGATTFQDELWQLNTGTGNAALFTGLSAETGNRIDVANIALNPDGSKILFLNKIDGVPWLLKR